MRNSSLPPPTDSEMERGMQYRIVSIKFKKQGGKTRIQVEYDDAVRSIINDPCESKFCKLLLEQGGTALERAQADQSLKIFSRFLLDHSVEVSAGYDCWNVFCSGRDCGIKSSRGILFTPPEDIETYGKLASVPEEQGHYKVHFTTPIPSKGSTTNLIKLRKGHRYLIAGQLGEATPYNPVSSRFRRQSCECGQCMENGFSRDLEKAIINPLEILSQRYQSIHVAGNGMWLPSRWALVCRDRDGTYRIRGYLTPNSYSEYICDRCKAIGKITTNCGSVCLELLGGKDGPDLDVVEPGNAAVQGLILEFCRIKFRKLRKALRQVIERLDSLGVKQGGPVLSDIARLVRATRMEVVYVLNNDRSLVQPIISGANCFLRRDMRGQWDSCDTLTGSELNTEVFVVNQDGAWIMIGSGDKYGVSSTDSGNYHLVLGGESMMYGAHLDAQEFGGPVM